MSDTNERIYLEFPTEFKDEVGVVLERLNTQFDGEFEVESLTQSGYIENSTDDSFELVFEFRVKTLIRNAISNEA